MPRNAVVSGHERCYAMTAAFAVAFLVAGHFQPETYLEPLPRQPILGIQGSNDPSGGVVLSSVDPNYTAGKSGLQPGDILTKLGSIETNSVAEIGAALRTLPGSAKALVKRNGKTEEINLTLVERPRDPGTDTVEVIYDSVVSHGERMRTIITRPRKAGRYPVMFFIQGIPHSSVEVHLGQSSYLSAFLNAFTEDYVTLRVEKPGVGDSEGPANVDLTFWREADIYVQALRAIKQYDFVKPESVYIFGHSMGGVMGPIAASQEPVAGLCGYGTFIDPWEQYMIKNVHRQRLLSTDNKEEADQAAEVQRKFGVLFFQHGLTPRQVLAADPSLQDYYNDNTSNDGTIFTLRSPTWHQQLAAVDLPSYWKKLDCHILSLYGAADFITFDEEHQRIAALNKKGVFKRVEGTDHAFYKRESEKDSQTRWGQPGEVNPELMKVVREWIDSVEAAQ